MTTERAVFAGGYFWGMQDLIRKLPGVISTRSGIRVETYQMRHIAITAPMPKRSRSSSILRRPPIVD